MTAAHQDPLYIKNSRIVRKKTNAALKAGRAVWCIGCGREIMPTQTFDVGHIIDAGKGGTHDLSNLGPQHRRENRRAGGRAGAAKTNMKRGLSREARRLPPW